MGISNYQKIKLLIIGLFCAGFLLIFNSYSKNGRYICGDSVNKVILDTQTGRVYFDDVDNNIYYDFIKDAKPYK